MVGGWVGGREGVVEVRVERARVLRRFGSPFVTCIAARTGWPKAQVREGWGRGGGEIGSK